MGYIEFLESRLLLSVQSEVFPSVHDLALNTPKYAKDYSSLSAQASISNNPATAFVVRTPYQYSVTAGTAFSDLTITVEDQFGNVTSSLDGTSAALQLNTYDVGTTPSAAMQVFTLPIADGAVDLSSFDTPTAAGTYGIEVRSSLSSLALYGESEQFTVVGGPATHLAVVATPSGANVSNTTSRIVAEAGVPATLTVAAEDQYGNPTSDTSSTISLSTTTPVDGISSLTTSNGTANFDDLIFTEQGAYTLTGTDGSLTPFQLPLIVGPPVLATTSTLAGKSIGKLIIDGQIYFPNLIASSARSSIDLLLNSVPASPGKELYSLVHFKHGVATVIAPRLTLAGTYSISANDTLDDPGFTVQYAVNPTTPKEVSVYANSASGTGKTIYSVSVQILDRYGNAVDKFAPSEASLKFVGRPIKGVTTMLTGTTDAQLDSNGYAIFSGLSLSSSNFKGRIAVTVDGLKTGLSEVFSADPF